MTNENFKKRVHEADGRGIVVTRSPEELEEAHAELEAQIKRIAERGESAGDGGGPEPSPPGQSV